MSWIALTCGGSAQAGNEAAILFSLPWSDDYADGAAVLGPLYNEASCDACHKDGGAARITFLPPYITHRGLVVRISGPDGAPDPVYGIQLQTRAVGGLEPEGRLVLEGKAEEPLQWRADFNLGPLAKASTASLLQAPSLKGRSAIETIPEEAIRANADPEDKDGDGISGRVSVVSEDGRDAIGRFGWQAQFATLAAQNAHAFSVDMGISSISFPAPAGDCTDKQPACLALSVDGALEIREREIADLDEFLATLQIERGPHNEAAQTLFAKTGCAACHIPKLNEEGPAIYSDLLLHDMGGGEEWRTAPLIDLNPQPWRRYMHDARAQDIASAIADHDGEAATARDAYERLGPNERDALISFLEGL